MVAPRLRNPFRRRAAFPAPPMAVAEAPCPAPLAPAAAPAPVAVWPETRIRAAESLWGEGFLRPGGAEGVLLLARPFGLTPAGSLLLLGGQGGGPARAVAQAFGCYVASFEADPDLVEASRGHLARARLGKHASVQAWDPRTPALRRNAHSHAILLEALRGAPMPALLAEVAASVRPGGQLALLDLVADAPLDPSDRLIAAWCRLDDRHPSAPTEAAITERLGTLGFDVRVVEDVSARHQSLALSGWAGAIEMMRVSRPRAAHAAALVAEAELWLLRLRLLQAGTIRLLRWSAIKTG